MISGGIEVNKFAEIRLALQAKFEDNLVKTPEQGPQKLFY